MKLLAALDRFYTSPVRMRPATARPPMTAAHLAVLLVILYLTFRLAALIWVLIAAPETGYPVVMLLSGILAVAGWPVATRTLGTIYRRFAKALALGLAAYLLLEPTSYVVVTPERATLAGAMRLMDVIGLAACALAFYRVSLLAIPGLHIFACRLLMEPISGIGTATHDIQYLADAGVLIALAAVVQHYAVRFRLRVLADDLPGWHLGVTYAIIGCHLANYFWSGVAKLALDGEPLEWLLHNDISQLYLVAIAKGVAPLAGITPLIQPLYDLLSAGSVVFNAFVLLLQLASLVVCFRLLWLRVSAVLFDIMHVGIFILGGILFWPWIWVNLSILWAFRGATDASVGKNTPWVACATLLFCGIPVLGGATWLAWYDVRDIRLVTVEAQAKGSQAWIEVPLSYLGAHAYPFSHGMADEAHHAGHFPPTVPGLAYSAERRRRNAQCILPAKPDEPPESAAQRRERHEWFTAFMRARHRDAVADARRWGRYAYYYRLHHHPSNPLLYEAFHRIDPQDIARYRLVTRSHCFTLQQGRLRSRLLKEDALHVDLP